MTNTKYNQFHFEFIPCTWSMGANLYHGTNRWLDEQWLFKFIELNITQASRCMNVELKRTNPTVIHIFSCECGTNWISRLDRGYTSPIMMESDWEPKKILRFQPSNSQSLWIAGIPDSSYMRIVCLFAYFCLCEWVQC